MGFFCEKKVIKLSLKDIIFIFKIIMIWYPTKNKTVYLWFF